MFRVLLLLLLLAFALLCYWCINKHAAMIEQDVLTNVQQTLSDEGIDTVYPTIDGRDVLLTGQLDTDQQRQDTINAVLNSTGVRAVVHTLALTPQAYTWPEASPEVVAAAPEPQAEPVPTPEPEPVPEPEPELAVEPIPEPPGLAMSELKLEMKWINQVLTLSGYMPDHEYKTNLKQQLSGGVGLSDQIKTTKLNGDWPQSWEKISIATAKQLQSLESGSAFITPRKLIVIGRARNNEIRTQLEQALRSNLGQNWLLDFNVDVPLSTQSVACETEIQKMLDAETINFELARSQIKQESHRLLLSIIDSIQSCESASFLIEGHTDDLGNEAFNMQLSEYRAFAVKNFLVANGVDANRIQIKGYGSSRPIADNSTISGRAANRRIEIVVLGESQMTNTHYSHVHLLACRCRYRFLARVVVLQLVFTR